ncbi:MAG: Dethiobiotin synthetase [Leptolyngbyaceae bacterium]|nr:Dethiobiotin synthetase [Leptolyngbyaceae bacterium]
MDYATAHKFLVNQGLSAEQNPDAFLVRLKQGKPPIPGQVTSLLLALKVVFESLRETTTMDRELAYALYILASESRQQFDAKRKAGVLWPPLLDEDVTRIAIAVKSIYAGTWNIGT